MKRLRELVVALDERLQRGRLVDYLRRLTFAWLIPVALIAVGFAGHWVYEIHRKQASEVASRAQHIAQEFDLEMQRRQHGLRSVVALTPTAPGGLDLVRLYNHTRAYDLVFGLPVILADEKRQILFNTRAPLGEPLGELPKPPGSSAVKDALVSGQPRVGDVVFAPVLGRKIVTVVVPIERHHALLGLVALPELEELLRRQALPKGWNASIHDSSANLIASTIDPPVNPRSPVSARRAHKQTHTTPWTVAIEASPWSFYRPHFQAALTLAVCIGLAFIGGVAAARRGSSDLSSWLRRLVPVTAFPDRPANKSLQSAKLNIAELESTRTELQRLMRSQYQFEEAERARVARELQSGLAQDASEAAMHIQMLRSQLLTNSPALKPAMAASESVRRVIIGIASAVHDLLPASLASGGLASALTNSARRFKAMTGMQVEVEVVGEETKLRDLPQLVADLLFRVTQERLSNIRKQAQATFVHLEVDVASPSSLRFSLSDDGISLSGTDSQDASGRSGIAEMAQALGAELIVRRGHDGDAERGTTVTLTIPMGT